MTDYSALAMENFPISSEWVSGDNVVSKQIGDHLLLAAIDGTGHGQVAHDVSRKMGEYLQALPSFEDPAELICQLHALMSPCIGASVGILILNKLDGSAHFSGIGNISAYILGHEDFCFVSKDGIVGQQMRKGKTQVKQLMAGDVIVLHSDGIKSRFYTQYERNAIKQPADLIINYIFNHFKKQYDDASCLVYRY